MKVWDPLAARGGKVELLIFMEVVCCFFKRQKINFLVIKIQNLEFIDDFFFTYPIMDYRIIEADKLPS